MALITSPVEAVLVLNGVRQNLVWEQVFVPGRAEIDQNQLSPKIFDCHYKGAFPGQKDSGFLGSNRLNGL
jgi:hypothetical protein